MIKDTPSREQERDSALRYYRVTYADAALETHTETFIDRNVTSALKYIQAFIPPGYVFPR